MAKEKEAASFSLWRELFQLGVYKRSQGQIARQITFAVLVLIVAVGAWRLSRTMFGGAQGSQFFATLGLVVIVGVWLCYRVVNLPRFADFLIAVQAEMNKVSWPTRGELIRSSIVVIVVIVGLAIILGGYDLFWRTVLYWLGVVA